MEDIKKTICIFSQTLLAGGAEKQLCLLAKALANTQNVFVIIYYGEKVDQKFEKILLKNEVEIIYLKGNVISKLRAIYKILTQKKVEILFSYLLLPSLIGGILGKISGVKTTFGGIRSSKIVPKKVLLNKIAQNWLNTRTIYNNDLGLNTYSEQGFDPNKAIVIQNCLEIIPEKITREKKEQVTIVSVGRFHEAKDYLTALKSIQLLERKNLDFKYQIVGYGHLENSIRNWIKELNLSDRVEVIINPNNLAEIYTEADIYFMTSIFEGLPNTVLEAMSFSLPIISTDVGDIRNILGNNKNDLIAPVTDTLQLANKLELLLNDYQKRLNIGLQNHSLVQSNFSFSKFKENHLDLINSLT